MNATPDQIRTALVKKLYELKAESHNAVNVYKCKEVLQGILDIVEVMLTGRATIVQPNQVQGMPIAQDPNKQHVEFYKTPEQQADGSIDPVVGGQGGGQRVEFFPNPGAGAAPQEPVRSADATAGQLVPGAATRNVEAGRGETVPLLPGQPQPRHEPVAFPIPVLEA
jgi:hypothetical protein